MSSNSKPCYGIHCTNISSRHQLHSTQLYVHDQSHLYEHLIHEYLQYYPINCLVYSICSDNFFIASICIFRLLLELKLFWHRQCYRFSDHILRWNYDLWSFWEHRWIDRYNVLIVDYNCYEFRNHDIRQYFESPDVVLNLPESRSLAIFTFPVWSHVVPWCIFNLAVQYGEYFEPCDNKLWSINYSFHSSKC